MTATRQEKVFDIVLYIIMGVMMLFILYLMIYITANAFSFYENVYFGKVILFPIDFTFENIIDLLDNDTIMRAYANTIYYTLLGTTISVVLTFITAYPLTRNDMPGRKWLTLLFMFTMFFSGGLIPLYLVISALGLVNTTLGFLLPGLLGIWHLLIVRGYINSSIPDDIVNAARVDGCPNFKLFLHIIMPLKI